MLLCRDRDGEIIEYDDMNTFSRENLDSCHHQPNSIDKESVQTFSQLQLPNYISVVRLGFLSPII